VTQDTRSLAKLAAEINRLHQLIVDGHKTAFEHATEIGQMLINAKKVVGKHGQWLKWLADQCPEIPETTSRLYMRIADKGPALEEAAKANGQRVADLTVRGAAKLLANPRDPNKPRRPKSAESSSAGSGSSPDLKDLLTNVGADELVTALRHAAWDREQISKLISLLISRGEQSDESQTIPPRRVLQLPAAADGAKVPQREAYV
jgi:hypothetical protein